MAFPRTINIAFINNILFKMPESEIFFDRSKLSSRYIPLELPHREEQIAMLKRMFKDSCIDPDKFMLTTTQIVGPSGIGKTSTVLRFVAILEDEFKKVGQSLKIAYINLKLQGGNKYTIYKLILEKIAPELPSQGLSAEEMLRYSLSYLAENKIYALIVLDEIDYLVRSSKDSSIIYDFTRLNEYDLTKHCNVLGVIFIARSTEFYNKIDKAELSTLGRLPINFESYSIDQISDILIKRCSEAFNPNVIGSDIIDEISTITASPQINGDIRYALDILLYVGNLAESNGTGRVMLDHVRKVHSNRFPSITNQEIVELPNNQLLTIMAIVKTLNIRKKQFVELKDIRANAAGLAEEYKIKKFEIEDYLHDLLTLKIIEMKSLKEIGISNIALKDIEPLLAQKIGKKK